MVTSRWIDQIYHVENGNIERDKARFIAIGFYQIKGVDYEETYVLVTRYNSINIIISLSLVMN